MSSTPSSGPDMEKLIDENGAAGHQDVSSTVLEAADKGDVKALADILKSNKEAFNAVNTHTGDKGRFHYICFGKKFSLD